MTSTVQTLYLWPVLLQLLALTLLGWAYRHRGYHDLRPPKARIFRCSGCRHIYIDSRRVPLSKCPKCARLNEMIRR